MNARRNYSLRSAAEKQAQKLANKRGVIATVYAYHRGDDFQVVLIPQDKAPRSEFGWKLIGTFEPQAR